MRFPLMVWARPMVSVNCIAASANVSAGVCLRRARRRHAAVQLDKFELCPESSHSLDARLLVFSNGWIGDRTFGGQKRSSDIEALNDDLEPTPEVSDSWCARSQRQKCCVSVKSGTEARRKNRSFMQTAARINGRIHRVRDTADLGHLAVCA